MSNPLKVGKAYFGLSKTSKSFFGIYMYWRPRFWITVHLMNSFVIVELTKKSLDQRTLYGFALFSIAFAFIYNHGPSRGYPIR